MPPESSDGFSAPAPAGRPASAIFRSASSPISLAPMSVCSSSGAATFSFTVRLDQSAPCWKSTPQRRSIAVHLRRRGVLDVVRRRCAPLPPSGRFSPMMVLSSTDLPAPEPPTTPSTSPRRTVRFRSLVDDVVADTPT